MENAAPAKHVYRTGTFAFINFMAFGDLEAATPAHDAPTDRRKSPVHERYGHSVHPR